MEATFARLIGENGELTVGFPVAQKDVQVEQYFSLIGKKHTEKGRHVVQEKDNECLLD